MQYVSVGRRFVAILIDGIIVGVVGFPFVDFQKTIGLNGTTTYHMGYHNGGFLGILGLTILYFALLEGFFGASIGKFVMGIRVVQTDGSRCTWRGSIIRNLLRFIDALPVAYIVGAILVWTSPTRQRLGDRVADTFVIKKGSNAAVAGGMGGTGSAAGINWPTPVAPGGVAVPPPPPPPPVGPPPGEQPPTQPM